MPEHYPKSVTDCWEFCEQCGRNTTHRVDDGRRGPCLDPGHGQKAAGSNLPYSKVADWIAGGYLWRETRCGRKGCGLPVIEFYLPNDPAYRVDPQTMRRHSEVCGDRARVLAMNRAEDRQETLGLDWKQKASGEK